MKNIGQKSSFWQQQQQKIKRKHNSTQKQKQYAIRRKHTIKISNELLDGQTNGWTSKCSSAWKEDDFYGCQQ